MELTPREKDKLPIFTAALLAERRKARGGFFRREAGADSQKRHDRSRGDGRSQRVDPDAAAGALPADVREFRQGAQDVAHFRLQCGD
jgi:Urease, gamma subunit